MCKTFRDLLEHTLILVLFAFSHHKSVGRSNSLVPCSDICGTVVSADGSSTLKPGQRVMAIFNQSHLTGQIKEKDMASGLGLPLPGTLTEYRCFPAEGLVVVPDYMSDEEACCS